MILLNAYILNNKYGKQKLSHDEYMEYIAECLLDKGIEGSTCIPQKTNRCNTDKSRLLGSHFMQKLPKNPSHKCDPNPICRGCNFTTSQMIKFGFQLHELPRKTTTILVSIM